MRRTPPPSPAPFKKADGILTADNHLYPRVPKCRSEDEYLLAMFEKLDFIAALQRKHECPVFCAGDMTDEWFTGKGDQWFVTEIIKRVKNWICVPGQHDLPQHNLELHPKSFLATLEAAGCVRVLLGDRPYIYLEEEMRIEGFPWGSKPEGIEMLGKHKKVALVHRMTYLGKPPYPGAQKTGGTAETLMSEMGGFDLIVTGDNHETFVCCDSDINQLLVNPGSMMRTSARQIDHKPCIFLWYADTNNIEQVFLPIRKGSVSREHLDQTERRDTRIAAFVERLSGKIDLDLSYKQNVLTYLDENKVRRPVKELLLEVLE